MLVCSFSVAMDHLPNVSLAELSCKCRHDLMERCLSWIPLRAMRILLCMRSYTHRDFVICWSETFVLHCYYWTHQFIVAVPFIIVDYLLRLRLCFFLYSITCLSIIVANLFSLWEACANSECFFGYVFRFLWLKDGTSESTLASFWEC